MAKIQEIEDMLRVWAAGVRVVNGDGFPTMSVLHPNWSPPSPGQTPTLKTFSRGQLVERVHEAIARLSVRSRNTVVVVYASGQLTAAEQALRLDCQVKTLEKRVEAIHRELAASLLMG